MPLGRDCSASLSYLFLHLVQPKAMLQIVAASAAIVVLHARTECLVHIAAILSLHQVGRLCFILCGT